MEARPAVLAAVLLLSACTTQHRVTVRGADIHRAVPTLREQGVARVEATKHTTGDRPESVGETMRMDQSVRDGKARHTVAALMRGCPDLAPFIEDKVTGRDCLLVKMREIDFEVRQFKGRSVSKFAWGALGWTGLAVAVGSITCALACDEGTTRHTASKYTLGAAGTVLAGWVAWEFFKCVVGAPCGR